MSMRVGSIAEIDAVIDYLKRIGAEVRSTRKAVVREEHGQYWKDICIINFSPEGSIDCSNPVYAPTEAEESLIKAAFKDTQWPRSNTIVGRVKVPEEMLVGVDPDDVDEVIFEFRNAAGEFVMFQKRVNTKKGGGKAYLPWTYWDDGRWRQLEPMGPLPLWGIDEVRGHDVVFVHEGAKAARHMKRIFSEKGHKWQALKKAFPWADEMEGAAHVGWIGGALNPDRTQWSELEALGVKKVYVVADNDQPGRDALREISRNINLPVYAIMFTEEWPGNFDLADPWPDSMFAEVDGVRVYIGPPMHACLSDITWATDVIPVSKGKPIIKLRDTFKQQWTYVKHSEVFVNNSFPANNRMNEQQFNKYMSAYSHTTNLAKLIHENGTFNTSDIVYKPDIREVRATVGDRSVINVHTPSLIKPLKGDPGLFIEFMHHLFPKEGEAKEMMKWCATLIARPEIRMSYGVLLVSEKQGMGKTTLGSHILAPLVGYENVGWPSEIDIVQSQFNDWIAEKRLVIVNEIYSGHSWKAYNNLKSYITDKDLRVNVKYQKPYVIENWAHFFACSNSLRALKMDENDRRWYYPSITEKKWAKERFDRLYAWLKAGGLRVVKHWAEGFGEYVGQSDAAPMSGAKQDLIWESYTKAQKEAAALGRALAARQEPTAVSTGDVEKWLEGLIGRDEIGSSGHELRKAMRQYGVIQVEKRMQINGRMHYVMINEALAELLVKEQGENKNSLIRTSLVNPELLLQSSM